MTTAFPQGGEVADQAPRFRRPNAEHALELAKEMFMRGERVDMQTLAAELDVARTTLYRWVGDREHLMGEVLAQLTEWTWSTIKDEATGVGIERGLDEIRLFMTVTSRFEPLVQFARREPSFALRVLMAEGGPVNTALHRCFTRAVHDNRPAGSPPVSAELVDVMVQLATALEWTPIVIGEKAAIRRAIELMRAMLDTNARATTAN